MSAHKFEYSYASQAYKPCEHCGITLDEFHRETLCEPKLSQSRRDVLFRSDDDEKSKPVITRRVGEIWYMVQMQPRFSLTGSWHFWGNYTHRADAMTEAAKYAPARVLEVTLICEIRKGKS